MPKVVLRKTAKKEAAEPVVSGFSDIQAAAEVLRNHITSASGDKNYPLVLRKLDECLFLAEKALG